jgi:Zn-dependent protease with chaperone function
MATYISADDYRGGGERLSLVCGFAILILILLFAGIATAGIVPALLIAFSAIVVWVEQSKLLGKGARVSERQFPEIYGIAKEAASRLCMHQPDVFIVQDPTLNAYAMGFLRKKSVVLHSATVEAMDSRQLQHIIGHEFSHIKCGHTNLTVVTSSAEGIPVPVVSQVLRFIFLGWSRKAEYTCDRGGLIACRDPESAIAAMCKLAVGPELYKKMNIHEFMAQHAEIGRDTISRLSEALDCDHPYLVKRVCALKKFYESQQFRSLVGSGKVESAADRQPNNAASPLRNGAALEPKLAEIAQRQNPWPRQATQALPVATAGQGSAGNVIAALCSLFVPGLGQLVQGRVFIGLTHFVLAVMLWVVLLGWAINLWSVVDAARFKPRDSRMP